MRYNLKEELKGENFVPSRRINFLICKLCHWCASYLYGHYKVADKCPICGNDSNNCMESIPISNEEAFEFEHNRLRGISLHFFPIDRCNIRTT